MLRRANYSKWAEAGSSTIDYRAEMEGEGAPWSSAVAAGEALVAEALVGGEALSRWAQRERDCLSLINHTASAAATAASSAAPPRCPVSWDRVHCWPSAPAGAMVVSPCMAELHGVFYDTSQNATRQCLWNGTWANYSNYTQCKELSLVDDYDASTMVLFCASFCISLAALAVAVWIFLYFKDLRCLRNTIHTNLMATYIFYDATWFMNVFLQQYDGDWESCSISAVLLHYFYLTNFFWMFVEGLYLFLLVVATFTGEKIKLRIYLVIGWGIPAVIVTTWAVAKHFGTVTSTNWSADTSAESRLLALLIKHCPSLAPDHFDLIHEAPVICVLAVNLVFLVSIMWVLITKLRSANTAETQQYRKATKAMLVLFPLLGITYILMLQGPKEGAAGAVFRNTRALLVGLQGFTVALFYCFLNTEVQNTLRHRVERWKEARAVGGGRRYTLSGHSKDWSPRSRTESIRLGDLPYGGAGLLGTNAGAAAAFHKRESTASATTTTTLLLGSNAGGGGGAGGAPPNGRVSNGSGTANTVRAPQCPVLPPGGEDAV